MLACVSACIFDSFDSITDKSTTLVLFFQQADYNANKMPAGCDSVLGAGKLEPCTSAQVDGASMPTGKPK